MLILVLVATMNRDGPPEDQGRRCLLRDLAEGLAILRAIDVL